MLDGTSRADTACASKSPEAYRETAMPARSYETFGPLWLGVS
jgi:hypothetical protein